jgi:choline dehydrogenase-like flavoprotein
MPTVPHGATNAPTIALAERAAALIKGPAPILREVRAVATTTPMGTAGAP